MALLLAGVIILAGVAVRAQADFTRAGDSNVPTSQRLQAARDATTLEPFMPDYQTRLAILTAQDLSSRGNLEEARRVLYCAYLTDIQDSLLRDQLLGMDLALQQRDAAGAMRLHATDGLNDVMPASVTTH
jgi:hypothetical protein